MDKNKDFKMAIIAVVVTLVVIGALVALCMFDGVLGTIVCVLWGVILFAVAMIKSKKDENNMNGIMDKNLKKLLSIPAGFNAYDVEFTNDKIDLNLYNEVSLIASNSKLDIKESVYFKEFKNNPTNESFYEFYDSWMIDLINHKFVAYLDSSVSMESFAKSVIEILNNNNFKTEITVGKLVKKYKKLLASAGVDENFKYDLVEANVVAAELRKYKLELVGFFAGSGNTEFAVIPKEKVEMLEKIEQKMN